MPNKAILEGYNYLKKEIKTAASEAFGAVVYRNLRVEGPKWKYQYLGAMFL